MKLILAVITAIITMSAHAIDLAKAPTTDEEWTSFLDVLAQVESGGNETIVKLDVNKQYSYGCLQIQQAYLTDSRLNYTLNDMLGKEAAYAVAKAYLTRYGAAYTKKTGKPATFEVLARIHNGGPSGWKRQATLPYVEKVKSKLI